MLQKLHGRFLLEFVVSGGQNCCSYHRHGATPLATIITGLKSRLPQYRSIAAHFLKLKTEDLMLSVAKMGDSDSDGTKNSVLLDLCRLCT